jgi:PHD/YefM family antitoxin component YafN of YafNO toxin-antitoxin module
MLEISQDLPASSPLERNRVAFLRRLKETGEPIMLTINGKAELVVQDTQSYLKLLELVDRLETLEGIRAGLEDMEAGRTKSLEAVREEYLMGNELPG